ncbi:MAG: hypothetical protein ACE5KE_00600 [Methanosarcinales archaeon]
MITANGIAGKAGKWFVYERIRIKNKCIIIIYAKKSDWGIDKYKVQIFNYKYEYWKEFNNQYSLRNYIKEIIKKIKNSELYLTKRGLISKKKFDKNRMKLQEKQLKEVKNMLLSGLSTRKVAKHFNLNQQTIINYTKKLNLKFEPKNGSFKYGKWVERGN